MGISRDQNPAALTDPVAFRAFYDKVMPRIYGYFLHRCGGDVAVAEDLTQDTFMAAVRDLKTRSPAISSEVSWIFGVARHKLLDFYRSQAREQRRVEALAGEAMVDESIEWAGDESYERAVHALHDVAESQRAALVLRYMDGLSVPEVATMLGKSVHATESLLARGRSRFRQVYAEVTA